MKVAVVGGGVIGSAIAYYLQKDGAEVVLLERGEIGGEASSAAAGMLIAPIEDTGNDSFDALREASLVLYPDVIREIQERSGVDVEYKMPGMIRTAHTEELAEELREACHRPGFEWVEGRALQDLEPGLATNVIGAAYCAADADLNPGALTRAFAGAAAALGADVRKYTIVTGFETTGGRITEVSTDVGDVKCDAVVLAAGAWTEVIGMRLDAGIATPPMRGQMISLRSDVPLHAVWGEDGYLVPKPGGLVFAGATVENAGFDKTTTADAIDGLRRMAVGLVPALRDAEMVSAWAGLRPGSADGLPVIGALPGRENAYVATGHFRNGVLLAPITGDLVADLVLTGQRDERLRAFGVERFG